jgi:chemotaxis protein MotB
MSAPAEDPKADHAAHDENAHVSHVASHRKHGDHEEDRGPKTPPWLISFGDMMTLFLCFFIMLVTMARTQDAGLMASGLGPFVAALESRGNDGALEGSRTLAAINVYRERFGLEPLTDLEMKLRKEEPKSIEAVEQIIREGLRPYSALAQPLVAKFSADSAELSPDAKRYLDLLAETLRPGHGQILVLEGSADDAGPRFGNDEVRLAVTRAQTVKDYLVKEHAFVAMRVEARAWVRDARALGASRHGVDIRLVQPDERADS